LNASWSAAAMRANTWMIPSAGRQRSPSTSSISGSANSASPTPNGTPKHSASRLDFTNASSSASPRSRTTQIAGYSVLVTTWSTRPV
jgi:hypothetical protein